MKKILKKIKDKELDVLFLIIVIVSVTLLMPISNYDELWNFSNSYKMFNGYKIYEELNVLLTPLFFYIAQIFFKIFGANLFVFRIYGVCIFATFLMLIYLIFKSLKIVRRRSIFYTLIMILIYRTMLPNGANYNIFVMIPILIAILLILKQKENPIYLGTLLFLTFMFKQNVFVYFAIGIFIYKIINRKNIKDVIWELSKIYIVSFIEIGMFLIYLYFDNNLYNFVNYCFLNIGEFGTKNFGIEIVGSRYMYIAILGIASNCFVIYNKKINIEESICKNSICLLCFGVPLLLISIPIVNFFHATLASTIVIIGFIYLLENILIKNLYIDRKKEKKIYIIAIVLYIIYMYISYFNCFTGNNKVEMLVNREGPFLGSSISKELHEDIKIICEYIKEQENNGIDVKILSYKANLYMVHLNKNNGIFDLPFMGNLGLGGEEELINKIKELKNTLILIQTREEDVFEQESKKARNYIINNYEKVEEIQEYSAFYIK